MLYLHSMTLYDLLFIINLVILAGIIVFHCFKKQRKAIIYNAIIFAFFVLLKGLQVHYEDIRSLLYNLLGTQRFAQLRNVLSDVLFFGTSITVGVDLVVEIVSIAVFVFAAARAAVIFAGKCPGKIFTASVTSEDEKADNRPVLVQPQLYLVLGKLIN